MDTIVSAWGNSLGVRIPKALAQKASLAAGAPVLIDFEKGRLVITPVRYCLDNLVASITPENIHQAVATGKRQGKELW